MSAPKPIPSGVSTNERINLLSDTGHALRQLKMKQQLIKISLTIIAFCLFITAGAYFYWLNLNNEVTHLREQLISLENQITTLQEINRIANIYSQRLDKIAQLQSGGQNLPPVSTYLDQLLSLSLSADGILNQMDYQSSGVTASFNFTKLLSVEKNLQQISSTQGQKLWSDSIITNFKRGQTGEYQVEFSAILSPNSTSPHE